jgi:hypothetical protein
MAQKMSALVHEGKTFSVLKQELMVNCDIFEDNPTLLMRPEMSIAYGPPPIRDIKNHFEAPRGPSVFCGTKQSRIIQTEYNY